MATEPRSSEQTGKEAPSHEARYAEAVSAFTTAVELLHKRDYEKARDAFRAIANQHRDELGLSDRATLYARICDGRLAPSADLPDSPDDLYHRAVFHANNGEYDEALGLLGHALQGLPDSPRALYARASIWALKGNADAAVADLRRAISTEPKLRFQAANDPDFEPVREEPAFIDVIEPTPAGG